jgi:MFS family permease
MNKDQSVCAPACGMKCLSWTPVMIGALFAIGFSFLLNLFSTAIGLSIYTVTPEGVSKLTVGGMVGFGIGVIASMFVAGWIAGYFGKSHCDRKHCGAVYGFATWCLALVIAIFMAAQFTNFVTGYSSYLANTVTTTAVSAVSENIPTPKTSAAKNEEAVNDLGKGTFVMFLMFLLGAAASTVGGHVGSRSCCDMSCCQKREIL